MDKMTKEESIQYWVDLSDYDMETASAMLQTKRYLYVGFMCHQTIEKILKGCFSLLKEDTPPYIRDLPRIAEKGGFYNLFSEEQKNFINALNPLNIEARYPEYKNDIAKMLTNERCKLLLEQTKKLQQWIKEKILSTK